jgi:hypothetical protein
MTRPKEMFTPLGNIIHQVLAKYRPTAGPALLAVWDIWGGVVGPEIAANARPAAFKGDLLLVHVSNSTWLHHLHCIQHTIIDRLNHVLGDACRIRTLKFKIGPI